MIGSLKGSATMPCFNRRLPAGPTKIVPDGSSGKNRNLSGGASDIIIGTGTLNIVGDGMWEANSLLSSATSETYTRYIERRGNKLRLDGAGTTNVIGNIYWAGNTYRGSTGFVCIFINNGHTFNLTGNIEHEPGTTSTTWVSNDYAGTLYNSNINITEFENNL